MIHAAPHTGMPKRFSEQFASRAKTLPKLGDGPDLSRWIDLQLAPELLTQSSKEKDLHRLTRFPTSSRPIAHALSQINAMRDLRRQDDVYQG